MTPEQILQHGDELYDALVSRKTVPPLLGRVEGITIEHAYRIQERMIARRVQAGEKIIGKKIGVTSKPVQDMLGVYQPDFGQLTSGMHYEEGELPIETFLAGRDTSRAIVTAVNIALPKAESFRFLKVSRVKPKGVSVLSIAALLRRTEDGTVTAARIALGCMADRPIRALAAEKALLGCKLTPQETAPALVAAGEGIAPITDPIASAWYRAEVLPVHLGRLLSN